MAKKVEHNIQNEYAKQFIAKMDAFGAAYAKCTLFQDFVRLARIELQQPINLMISGSKDEQLEREYISIMKRYKQDERMIFLDLFVILVEGLEAYQTDMLGEVFETLDCGSQQSGQFFTPEPISKAMALMTLPQTPPEGDFITVLDSACGTGSTLIAALEILKKRGFKRYHVHFTACDIAAHLVDATYIQLTLLGMPALVYHTNALSGEVWNVYPSFEHVNGLWDRKLRRKFKKSEPTQKTSNKTQATQKATNEIEREQLCFHI
ncbi:MAG: N-6 DNA methylase [Thiotrichaceae bacterium]|nr:N-6 DNA methylase [Thiotrichaceae bacterium]